MGRFASLCDLLANTGSVPAEPALTSHVASYRTPSGELHYSDQCDESATWHRATLAEVVSDPNGCECLGRHLGETMVNQLSAAVTYDGVLADAEQQPSLTTISRLVGWWIRSGDHLAFADWWAQADQRSKAAMNGLVGLAGDTRAETFRAVHLSITTGICAKLNAEADGRLGVPRHGMVLDVNGGDGWHRLYEILKNR